MRRAIMPLRTLLGSPVDITGVFVTAQSEQAQAVDLLTTVGTGLAHAAGQNYSGYFPTSLNVATPATAFTPMDGSSTYPAPPDFSSALSGVRLATIAGRV